MQAFDASSIVYAWDNYPIRQFPPLWDWMARQTEGKTIVMSRVAFNEVVDVSPDCADWLRAHNVELIEVSNEIAQDALRIKGLLGIANDQYHPKGVNENDLLIIATARAQGVQLVSDENKQPRLPDVMPKYKIPAVCLMQPVTVSCVNFVEYLKASNQVFA